MKLFTKLKRYDDTHNFTCDVCGREVFTHTRVCEKCRDRLPMNDGLVCPYCGRKVREPGVCIECRTRPVGVEKARSVCLYKGEAKRLVVRYKRGEKYLYRTLAELALPLAEREFPDVDAIMGVPMTEKATKKRGYNQAALLAECLAERMQKPAISPVVKHKETASQKSLTRKERESNLDGCFRVASRGEIKGKRILIVDDVLTTGATVFALADVMSRAGAAKVYALTFASTEKK